MAAWNPRANDIFLQALDFRSPQERSEYLNGSCGTNAELRAQVESLLSASERAGSFLESPVADLVSAVDDPLTPHPGTVIGPYKLLEQVGEGGFGVVYMAEQQQPVRRKVALKVLKPGMDTKQVVARFEAERQALALMDHPHIAHVLDAGATDSGRPYFVMELIRGIPITAFCDNNRLTPRERLELFLAVCQAVQHAHQKGIIHRDLKPSNVLVTLLDGTPVVKVIDFGIAKALGQERLTDKTLCTGFAHMLGTPLYMSPEQAAMSGQDVDTRTDIYALGVLLYELLTGTTPFDKERLKEASYEEIRRIIREEEPVKPSTRISTLGQAATTVSANRKSEPKRLSQLFRRELDWIVIKALEKDRNRRFDTASSFAADVQRYLDDEPVQACPPSAGYRLRKVARKYRMPVIVAAAFALLLIVGVVVSVWQAVRATHAEHEATRKREDAEAAEERAHAAEARWHRLYYAECMGHVQAAWESHDIQQVRDLLAETADFPERGFEWYYWQRLCHTEHLTLLGHQGGVAAVAFSPNGQRLVTGGTDGTARVWDITSGRQLLCLRGHRRQVTAVAVAPNGQWVVSSSTDGTARVWNAVSGTELRILRPQNTGPVWAVAVTPDGKRVVTASEDGNVRVWDASSGRVALTLQGHTGPVWAVAVTSDGKRVVTGSWDRTARVWDAETGRELLPSLEHKNESTTSEVTAVAISANGQWLVTGYGNFGVVHLWDAATGREVDDVASGSGMIRSVAVTADGKRVVSANGKVWDTASRREILSLEGGACVAVSPDGQRLATGSMDGIARIWDTARLWDATKGQELLTLKGHSAEVASVAVTRDGQRIVTGGGDSTVRLWDAASGRQLRKIEFPKVDGHIDGIMCVAVTPDGQRIVAGGWAGTVTLWDAVSGDVLQNFTGHTGRSRSGDGPDMPGSRRVWSVAVTSDGQRIVSGSEDGTARVWDAFSGRQIFIFKGHTGQVQSVALTPDGQRLVTGGNGNMVQLWDMVSGRELLPAIQHTGGVWSLAVTADGQRIVSGGGDGTVRLWDAHSGRELLILKGHTGRVWSVAVTSDAQRIVSGSEDGTARVWDAFSGRELLKLKGHTRDVRSVAVSSDGRRLITGSFDGTVKIWEAPSPEQMALWTKQDQQAALPLAAWQRPGAGALGFIQDWLILAPIPVETGQRGAKGLVDREQLEGEAKLRPREGKQVRVGNKELSWKAHHEKQPILDFNRFVGDQCDYHVAYAVCYLSSEVERSDLLLQVGSDDEAKVYLNGQEIYKYLLPRGLVALDPIGPVRLRKGTNVLVLKVVNETLGWEACARFVDQQGNPAQGLQVRLTPE